MAEKKNSPLEKKTRRWDGTPAADGAGARRQAGLMAHISMVVNGGAIGHHWGGAARSRKNVDDCVKVLD